MAFFRNAYNMGQQAYNSYMGTNPKGNIHVNMEENSDMEENPDMEEYPDMEERYYDEYAEISTKDLRIFLDMPGASRDELLFKLRKGQPAPDPNYDRGDYERDYDRGDYERDYGSADYDRGDYGSASADYDPFPNYTSERRRYERPQPEVPRENDDYSSMSIRELKDLAAQHGINISGIVDKSELVKKIRDNMPKRGGPRAASPPKREEPKARARSPPKREEPKARARSPPKREEPRAPDLLPSKIDLLSQIPKVCPTYKNLVIDYFDKITMLEKLVKKNLNNLVIQKTLDYVVGTLDNLKSFSLNGYESADSLCVAFPSFYNNNKIWFQSQFNIIEKLIIDYNKNKPAKDTIIMTIDKSTMKTYTISHFSGGKTRKQKNNKKKNIKKSRRN